MKKIGCFWVAALMTLIVEAAPTSVIAVDGVRVSNSSSTSNITYANVSVSPSDDECQGEFLIRVDDSVDEVMVAMLLTAVNTRKFIKITYSTHITCEIKRVESM